MGLYLNVLLAPCNGVPAPHGRRKYSLLITDSKQLKGQGQRRETGILWISESGIRVPAKSSEISSKWALIEDFGRRFAQVEAAKMSLLADRTALRRDPAKAKGAPCGAPILI